MIKKNALVASLFIGFVTTNTFAADAAPRLLKKAEPIQLEGGEWYHELHVNDTLIPCARAKSSPIACVAYSIEVFNTSLQPLDCMVNVWVPGYANPSKLGPMRVNWRSQGVAERLTREREKGVPTYDMICTPLPKIDSKHFSITVS